MTSDSPSAVLPSDRGRGLWHDLLVFAEFSRIAFLKILAYRIRYVTGIFSYLVYVSGNYYIWLAVFSDQPNVRIGDYDRGTMITHVAIGWIARSFYYSNIDREMSDEVVQGRIAMSLLRPVSYQMSQIAVAFGESLFRLVFFSAPIALVIAMLFPVQGPDSAGALLGFLASTAIGFVVLAAINFLVGVLAIHLESIQGIIRAKHFVLDVFSGLLIPLPLFPGVLRTLADIMPFRQIAYVPLQIYLGHVAGNELVAALLGQALWAVGLLAAGVVFFRLSMRRLSVQGG